MRTTGIPFGYLWCLDTLKLLSCLQCWKCDWQRRTDLHFMYRYCCVVPAVTLFRTIYKPLHSRSHCRHYLSTYLLCHTGSMKNVCNVWVDENFANIMFCTGHSRGEEQALDCRCNSVDCVFIPLVTLLDSGRLTVVRLQQSCSSLRVFCPRVMWRTNTHWCQCLLRLWVISWVSQSVTKIKTFGQMLCKWTGEVGTAVSKGILWIYKLYEVAQTKEVYLQARQLLAAEGSP